MMRPTGLRFLAVVAVLLLLIVALVACNGDENDDQDDEPGATATDPNFEGEPAPGQGIDTSGVALTPGIETRDGLTLISESEFVYDNRVVVAYLVRNDSQDTFGNVRAILSFIDAENLELATYNITSAAANIAPGQVIALQGSFPEPDLYADISGLVRGVGDIFAGYTPYLDAETDASFDTEQNVVTGTATNTSSDPLVQLVAYFILYGETEDDLLQIIPAVPSAGIDEQGFWQPGVTVSFTARVTALPASDPSAIKSVQLKVTAYQVDLPESQ
ncbi:MAG: hypothetical protein GYB66_01080 [Chloroflexi bacterium]|nr:hypothetical protein [Chloroflexota bacterium]